MKTLNLILIILVLLILISCSKQEINYKINCENYNGTWISESNECESITKEQCNNLTGTFNECASPCRNDLEANMCIMSCVPVCKFNN